MNIALQDILSNNPKKISSPNSLLNTPFVVIIDGTKYAYSNAEFKTHYPEAIHLHTIGNHPIIPQQIPQTEIILEVHSTVELLPQDNAIIDYELHSTTARIYGHGIVAGAPRSISTNDGIPSTEIHIVSYSKDVIMKP